MSLEELTDKDGGVQTSKTCIIRIRALKKVSQGLSLNEQESMCYARGENCTDNCITLGEYLEENHLQNRNHYLLQV